MAIDTYGRSVLALGETARLLHRDVVSYACGLFCDAIDVNLVNTGAIDVNAIGEYAPDTKRHSLWLRYGWQF